MKKTQYLKILSFLFIILAIEGIIALMCKTTKSAKNEDEYKTSVTRIAINPIEKNKEEKKATPANRVTRITSSSRLILERIVKTMENTGYVKEYWNRCENAVRTPTPTSGGLYYIDIPSFYFNEDVGGGWDSTQVYFSKKITEFDFSGLNLGGINALPDFSKWPNLKRLNFSNCNLTNVSGFSKSAYIKNINYINLSKNRIADIKTGIVCDSRFNLSNQTISLDLGTIKNGNKGTGILPNIFVKSYGNISAPKDITVSNLKRNGNKVIVTSAGGDRQTAIAKISEKSSSPFRGSYVVFNWKGTKASTNTNNNNNGNNGNNGNYDDTYYYNMSLTYEASSSKGYYINKYINIYPIHGENVVYDKAKIYVNGNYVGNNTYSYNATKNGTYTIKITYPGLDDIVFTHKVTGIDNEPPTFTVKYEKEMEKNTKIMKVRAEDNEAISKIVVNGKEIYKCNKKDYYYIYTATYRISESGKYNIQVYDLAGNANGWDEYVNVDTTPPKIQNVKIKKDDKIYDKDKCGVGIGDKLIIELTANEDVKYYEGIYINGTQIDNKNVQVGSKQFAVEIPITEVFGQRKFIWRFKNKNK